MVTTRSPDPNIAIRMVLPAAALALAVSTAAAQQAGQRAELVAFRDSVGAVQDAEALRRIESNLMLAARRDRANAMLHLRLGAVAEHVGAWRDAAAEYKWAAELEPRWPEAWWGWGLAELRIGDEVEAAATNRHLRLARDAWVRAAQAVARAVELDPDLASRVVLQAQAAVAAGRADWGRVLRDGLARPARRRDPDGRVLLALGRVERVLGDSAAAVLAFEAAAGVPGHRGIGLLERARTQLTAGDDRGIAAYYGGASADEPEGVRAYRGDLALIATDRELTRFDQLPADARPAFLWDLWTDRDRGDLRRNGERLMEHYRRIAAARSQYGSLDDLRARVLVRHGEPDGRASIRHASAPPNESWWYGTIPGPFVVHFVARADSGRYELLESLFEIAEAESSARSPTAAESATAAPVDPDLLLRSRAQLAPFYQAAVEANAGASASFRERERRLGALGMSLALETDAHPVRFARELPARTQVAGLGGALDSGLWVIFSIPGFAAEPLGGAGIALYPTRIRAVVRDTAGGVVRALDTVLVVEREERVAGPDRWGASLAIPLPTGTYDVRAAIEHGAAGAFLERRVAIPPVEPGRLALSDLLLASRRGAPLRMALGDRAVPVDPAPVLDRSDTLMVRGQVLAAHGDRGRFRILVRPVRTGDERRWRPFPGLSGWLTLDLSPSFAGSVIEVGLPIRRLERGAYELQVVVIDGAGATVWQQAEFEVDDRP